MLEKKRPTAKKILDGIIQAMYDAQEPLDEGLILVPPVYDVLLHPEAFQALRWLTPRIKEQAKKRLDAELENMNRPQSKGLFGWFRRLRFHLARLLFADRYIERGRSLIAQYERAGNAWHVDVGVTAEPDADLHYLAVETSFDAQGQTAYKGRPTVNIRRRTVVLPNGRFETVLSTARPTPVRPQPTRSPTRETPPLQPDRPAPAYALARLSFEDNTGRQVYYMTKPLIRIGRKEETGEGLDVALGTLADVSREHAQIRHEPQRDLFAIKDLSRYGITVDGKKIQPRKDEADATAEGWHPLPRHAEIGLANAIFITFEAL